MSQTSGFRNLLCTYSLTLRVYLEVSCAPSSGMEPGELHFPEDSAPIAFGVKLIRTKEVHFLCEPRVGPGLPASSWWRSFCRPLGAIARSRVPERRVPDERVRRETLAAPGPGEKPLSPRPAASPAARDPAPPAESDGGGSAEGPAPGKRWSSGPAPPSAHQAQAPSVHVPAAQAPGSRTGRWLWVGSCD